MELKMCKIWKTRFRLFLGSLILITMMIGSQSIAQDVPDKSQHRVSKTSAWLPTQYQILNINNLWTWAERDGESGHSAGGDYGTFFPRGQTYIAYQDGFVFGSQAYRDAAYTQPAPFSQTIRVGGATYNTGYRPGWVTGLGATAQPADIGDPRARMYRIRRDWKEMPPDEVRRDAAESREIPLQDVTDEMIQLVLDQYAESWNMWPVDLGAPFIDRNGNGVYDAPPAGFAVKDLIEMGYDEPGIAGGDPNSPADQVLFTIYNDLHRATSFDRFGSEPTGLEVQETVWGYKRSGPLGNMYFRKWRFINKGGVDIDGAGTMGAFYLKDMYVVQWADMTNGDYTDDCLGCDTTLSMGYVWNGNAIDRDFRAFNLPPAAGGFDFLQGPVVPAAGDRAVFNLQYKDDYRNLPMTGWSYFSAASAYSDPGGAYDTNTIRWYKMMRGFAPIGAPDEDIRYNFPPGATPNNYPLAGDPTTGTGHIDCQGTPWSIQPGDRRQVLVSGPFQMAPGDTNEAVIAFVCGLGADRFSSISVMKFNDRFAQNTYDALFQVPSAPAPPIAKSAELNGKVILEWGSSLERVNDTENDINEPGGFKFEGYNLYQLPSPTASINDGRRIATFDRITDPAVVLDEQFDAISGQILSTPVQYGTNSGITRKFVFDRDYVLDTNKLNNGVDYYLAVTAYSVSTVPGFLPQSLESPLQIIRVVPKVPFGTTYEKAYGDPITVTHSAGKGNGSVESVVINPVELTGNEYRVTFSDDDGDLITDWTLTNQATNQVLLANQSTQTGSEEDYLFTEGFQLIVSGDPLSYADFSTVANSAGPLEPAEGAGGRNGFPGSRPSSSVQQPVGGGQWFFRGPDGADFSDLLADSETRWPNIIPYDYEIRFTGTSVAYDPADNVGLVLQVPFELWQIGNGTPDDASDDIRMVPYIRDVDADGTFNLGSGGDITDGITFAMPDNTAPGSAGYDAWETQALTIGVGNADDGSFYNVLAQDDNIRDVRLWDRAGAGGLPEAGTVFRVSTTKPNSVDDVFTFTTPGAVTSDSLNHVSIAKIGVFPNPYHAYNPMEVNKLGRFVTFNNLPPTATIRIFAVSGHLVRTIEKSDASQFTRWDLINQSGLPVASGVYIAHIDMPDIGTSKVLKLVIVMEAEILDIF